MSSSTSTLSAFEVQLREMINQFKLYEVPSNKAAALSLLPTEFLMSVAQAKVDSSDNKTLENLSESEKNDLVKDMFLLEVMTWFKGEFFSWMDTPACPSCNLPTVALGYGEPSQEELSQSAGRVETFTCARCHSDRREVARFPRYNHPAILLKTRKGRCGEWANCFALICRAAGFEVRYVRDWTDHVWVEVMSCSEPKRWVHADPCENSYDSPLLYCKGWGKKLSYIIAVSQDEIQDVTWKYIEESQVQDVLSRRTQISEYVLVKIIRELRRQMQNRVPAPRSQVLQARLIKEMAEFLFPRKGCGDGKVRDSEMHGRGSGSLAWRLARQEIGTGQSTDDDSNNSAGFVWMIHPSELTNSTYLLTYECSKDVYTVHGQKGTETKVGWKQGVQKSENLFRKQEHDWKMVYLARTEQSCQDAVISWAFTLSDSTYQIVAARISTSIAIFSPSASITITLTDESEQIYKLLDSTNTKEERIVLWASDPTFQGCNSVTLECALRGGEGSLGWQHVQLFRQSVNPTIDSIRESLRVELTIAAKP